VKENPYDFKDEAYFMALEKQKLERERLETQGVHQLIHKNKMADQNKQ